MGIVSHDYEDDDWQDEDEDYGYDENEDPYFDYRNELDYDLEYEADHYAYYGEYEPVSLTLRERIQWFIDRVKWAVKRLISRNDNSDLPF